MLDLSNVEDTLIPLIDDYNLCVSNIFYYLFDTDLENLFADSNIKIGQTLHKAKDWKTDNEGWIVECQDGEYLESIELIQNGKTYKCRAFAIQSCHGLDYFLQLDGGLSELGDTNGKDIRSM